MGVLGFIGVLSCFDPLWFVSTLVNALIVGLLQGLLEWLPISSQGSLVLLMIALLGLEPAVALGLTVYLHIGTGLAALTYFRRDISRVLRLSSEPDQQMLRFLVVATVVTGVVGLPLFLFAKMASIYGETLLGLTGVALISTGIVERSTRRWGVRTDETLSRRESLILGLVQGFSAIPGVSRSGITTSALLLRGFSGKEAFRISFLMSVPAVFAAAFGLTIVQGAPPLRLNLLVALAASFLSALLSIDFLLRMARKLRFWSLCMMLGVLALIPLVLYML